MPKVSEVDETLATGAIPVPARLTVDVPPEVLLFTVRAPVRLPRAVGVKVTMTEQVAPAARVLPQLFVWLKSPVIPILLMVSVAVPVFVNVTLCAALDVFTSWSAKVKVAGDKLATGTTPAPESVMGFTATVLLLVSDRVPLRTPVAVGVNVTAIVQPVPGFNPLPQLLV